MERGSVQVMTVDGGPDIYLSRTSTVLAIGGEPSQDTTVRRFRGGLAPRLGVGRALASGRRG